MHAEFGCGAEALPTSAREAAKRGKGGAKRPVPLSTAAAPNGPARSLATVDEAAPGSGAGNPCCFEGAALTQPAAQPSGLDGEVGCWMRMAEDETLRAEAAEAEAKLLDTEVRRMKAAYAEQEDRILQLQAEGI